MKLAESSWTELAATETDLAVLPVGSTEQHGPHAVLGTDRFTAEAVASEGVDRASNACVLGPAIPVGVSAEHRQFPGTLWVSEDTFRAYVRETCESLVAHGWDRIVLVNGHGGNVAPLREICGTITRRGDAYAVSFTWFDAIDPAAVGDAEEIQMGHGGPVETSLLHYLDQGYVRPDHLEEGATRGADRWGEWHAGVNLAYDSAEFTENGVVGDPRDGSAQLGEKLLDAAADELAELLSVVANRDVSRPELR